MERTWLRNGYKAAAIALVLYAVLAGLLKPLPDRGALLGQSMRSVFYHVPMWFAMMLMAAISVLSSIQFLQTRDERHDWRAEESARIAILFGVLGLITGSIWSRVTWGAALPDTDLQAWWNWTEPKLTMALLAVLIYLAYLLVRNSFEDSVQRARVAAVYNVFAAATLIPLFYILPKILGGLHPGSGAEGEGTTIRNFSGEFAVVFWPAVAGMMLTGTWILELRMRIRKLEAKLDIEP